MSPGEPVFAAVLDHFGREVLGSNGDLDRTVLGRLAFSEGRVAELNALVHPAVIARQAELAAELEGREPDAVLVVESALVFETEHAGAEGWHTRFDRLVLVVAEEGTRIKRFVARALLEGSGATEAALAAEARRRLANQMKDDEKVRLADVVLRNDGSLQELDLQVQDLWNKFVSEAGRHS